MNRLILIAVLVLVVPVVLFAQIDWTKHTIKSDWDGAWGVYAIDMDNENDVDVTDKFGNVMTFPRKINVKVEDEENGGKLDERCK